MNNSSGLDETQFSEYIGEFSKEAEEKENKKPEERNPEKYNVKVNNPTTIRNLLAVANATHSEPGHYAFHAVQIETEDNGEERNLVFAATDGRMLAIRKERIEEETEAEREADYEYKKPVAESGKKENISVMFDGSTLKKTRIPKTSVSVLELNGSLEIKTETKSGEKRQRLEKEEHGVFPEYKRLLPEPEKEGFSMNFSLEYLKKVLDCIGPLEKDSRKTQSVEITFYEKNSPVLFRSEGENGSEFLGVLAPIMVQTD